MPRSWNKSYLRATNLNTLQEEIKLALVSTSGVDLKVHIARDLKEGGSSLSGFAKARKERVESGDHGFGHASTGLRESLGLTRRNNTASTGTWNRCLACT